MADDAVNGSSPASTPPGPACPWCSASLPAADARVCPACGARTEGAKFCPECGKPLRPKNECPRCGTTMEAKAKFCPECGQKAG